MAAETDLDKKKYEAQYTPDYGYLPINPKACKTCRFSHGDPPWEDSPMKAYCMIYSREEGDRKPDEVYHHGEDCEYYSKYKGN